MAITPGTVMTPQMQALGQYVQLAGIGALIVRRDSQRASLRDRAVHYRRGRRVLHRQENAGSVGKS